MILKDLVGVSKPGQALLCFFGEEPLKMYRQILPAAALRFPGLQMRDPCSGIERQSYSLEDAR